MSWSFLEEFDSGPPGTCLLTLQPSRAVVVSGSEVLDLLFFLLCDRTLAFRVPSIICADCDFCRALFELRALARM